MTKLTYNAALIERSAVAKSLVEVSRSRCVLPPPAVLLCLYLCRFSLESRTTVWDWRCSLPFSSSPRHPLTVATCLVFNWPCSSVRSSASLIQTKSKLFCVIKGAAPSHHIGGTLSYRILFIGVDTLWNLLEHGSQIQVCVCKTPSLIWITLRLF